MVWGRYPQGAATPTINTEASPNPNGLNSNVTFGRNSVGIAAPGDSGPCPSRLRLGVYEETPDQTTQNLNVKSQIESNQLDINSLL